MYTALYNSKQPTSFKLVVENKKCPQSRFQTVNYRILEFKQKRYISPNNDDIYNYSDLT